MTLKVLRNFGHTITNIRIYYNQLQPNAVEKIEFYVAEYCSESLEKLFAQSRHVYEKHQNKKQNLFEHIAKQFPKLKELIIYDCTIGPKLFNRLFPNLEYLVINSPWYSSDFSVIKEHFPNLKKLSFHRGKIDEIHIMDMMKLNPQLERLRLDGAEEACTHTLLECIRKYLPLLEYFQIDAHRLYSKGPLLPATNRVEPFHFDNVIEFRFTTLSFSFPISSINLFTFSKLEYISMGIDVNLNEADTYQPILKFLQRNTHLKSIAICGRTTGNLNTLFDFEFILSNVEQLNIESYYYKFSGYHRSTDIFDTLMCKIIRFLKRNESLKTLIIKGKAQEVFHFTDIDQFSKAISLNSTESKITDHSWQKCRTCIASRRKYVYKTMEFTISKEADFSSMKYICSFGKEIIPFFGPQIFIFMEFSKLN